MRHGISVPNFGPFADPDLTVGLAVIAEEAGWDGFFVWDHIAPMDGLDTADPWTLLAAVATSTNRVAIGPMVTPLPRRRPWVVARQTTTLDHLSQGRLILGVGLGTPPDEEFGRFGEPTDPRVRADMLEEGLEIIQGMWTGQHFAHDGEHYTVSESVFAPTPAGRSRIPIWVGATWPNRRPLRRATRFDGVFPFKMDMTEWRDDEVEQLISFVVGERGGLTDFDVALSGSFDESRRRSSYFESAGVTWFLAGPDQGGSIDDLRAEISRGP